MMRCSQSELASARAVVRGALDEELFYGPDATTAAIIASEVVTTASLITRHTGVIAGVDIALLVLDSVAGIGDYRVIDRVEDGTYLLRGAAALTVEARTRALLTAERTMLNLVAHLSGVATATAAWVDAVAGTSTKICDTRNTLPGLRSLQKYAVRVGGGVNHRMGLGDAMLIKDSHITAAGSVAEALRVVRAVAPRLPCEVKVDSLGRFDEALAERPELVLLDNFAIGDTANAVQRRDAQAPEVILEASGGLSLDAAAAYACTGVDYLGVATLTHSAQALDMSLDM